ncbi:hypothetical protein [Variovorax sp. ZT4R33]|uniref:hypothetical protein n=1 Tax=Variovorax sp. ZT4R33 TaxID=3443743 RepID=UPI003F46CFD9
MDTRSGPRRSKGYGRGTVARTSATALELWANQAYKLAVAETWNSGTHGKLFMMEPGTEARVAQTAKLALESVARLGRLVTESTARADAMRLEAALPDDVMLELQAMAAAIHAEYQAVPRPVRLSSNFIAPIPGVMVMEITDMSEASY